MKIQFFYTSGHTFTATNVTSYGEIDAETMQYSTESYRGDIRTVADHEVPMFDLLFAIVTPSHGELPAEGEIHTSVIIHGRASKFDITVAPQQAQEIIDEAHEEALIEERHLNWKEKEKAAYRARQKARNVPVEDGECELECIKCRI